MHILILSFRIYLNCLIWKIGVCSIYYLCTGVKIITKLKILVSAQKKGFVFDGRVYYISNSDQLMVTNSFSPCQRVIGFLSFGYSRFQVLMVV